MSAVFVETDGLWAASLRGCHTAGEHIWVLCQHTWDGRWAVVVGSHLFVRRVFACRPLDRRCLLGGMGVRPTLPPGRGVTEGWLGGIPSPTRLLSLSGAY